MGKPLFEIYILKKLKNKEFPSKLNELATKKKIKK